MVSGRKRAFDEDKALQAAMEVFWQKGYIGASLSDLTEKMGINKPSMYSAFGNKEKLFVKATKLYIEKMAGLHADYLSEPGVALKSRLKNYLMSVVAVQCELKHPRGCYIVLCQSELAGGDMPDEAASLLTETGASSQIMLEEFFRDDPEAKSLGLNNNARGRALCLVTTLRGTASMARTGTPLSELKFVIDCSLEGIGL